MVQVIGLSELQDLSVLGLPGTSRRNSVPNPTQKIRPTENRNPATKKMIRTTLDRPLFQKAQGQYGEVI